MAEKIKVWFDAEADFLEVHFSDAAGYEKETTCAAFTERLTESGHVIGDALGKGMKELLPK